MADHLNTTANYCPVCGSPVAHADSIAADTEISVQGVFKRENAHAIVEGSVIKIFQHGSFEEDHA